MSPSSYLSYGGLLPKALTDPDGLVKFKELIAQIRENFVTNIGESGPCPIFLAQLGNVSDINSLVSQLFMFKDDSELAIGDFEAVFRSIDNALCIFANRGLNYIKVQVTPEVNTIEVNFVNPGTTDSTTPNNCRAH